MKNIRIVIGASCMLSLCTTLGRAQSPSIDEAMAGIRDNPRTAHAVYASEVYDLDAQRPLYAYNAQSFVTAASTTKLVTEGTTLTLLGQSFRWTTPVYRSGEVDARGTLHGNVILVGSGDPNLSGRVRPDGSLTFANEDHTYGGKAVPGDPLAVLRDLAQQVRRAGIRQIDGRVSVDATLFPESSEDGTGLTVSPIVVNDNAVDVTVAPGAHPGDPVAIDVSPQTSYVTFVNHATTAAASAPASIDMSDDTVDASGRHRVTINGQQPAGAGVLYPYAVTNPKLFAGIALTQALGDAGVHVAQAPQADESSAPTTRPGSASDDGANLIAKHVSPPLSEDVYVTLKVSQNLHAHLMPYLWGVYGAHAQADVLASGFTAGAAALQRAGVDLGGGAVVNNGEGAAAFFTPDWMVRYLAWAHRQPWFPVLLRGLPIMGVDGTLADIQTTSPARGKVFAKTGTDGSGNRLRGDQLISKGLAGYMTTSHGRHVAFAFYLDHLEGPAQEDTAQIAGQILGSMATATFEQL